MADPAPLPDGSSVDPESDVTTIHSIEPSGPRYRALAFETASGGRVVIALSLADVDATLDEARRIQLIVGLAAIAGVAAVCWLLIRRAFAPIDGMIATAGRIAEGDLTERTTVDADHSEVGRLGSALNVMLDRIESAVAEKTESEERMRRFVADASHDLRTPLTSVRGYAELYRQDADNPATVAVSMERIEEEATRMSRLVDDLMLLARLDQRREPATTDRRARRRAGPRRRRHPAHRSRTDLRPRHGRSTPGSSPIPTSCARSSTTCSANARAHTPAGNDGRRPPHVGPRRRDGGDRRRRAGVLRSRPITGLRPLLALDEGGREPRRRVRPRSRHRVIDRRRPRRHRHPRPQRCRRRPLHHPAPAPPIRGKSMTRPPSVRSRMSPVLDRRARLSRDVRRSDGPPCTGASCAPGR